MKIFDLVVAAIKGERAYQEQKWNPMTTASGGTHEVGAWLTFMRSYLREAEEQISRGGDPQASDAALHTIRKIVTLGVACLEQHGPRFREGSTVIALKQNVGQLPSGSRHFVASVVPHGGYTDESIQFVTTDGSYILGSAAEVLS